MGPTALRALFAFAWVLVAVDGAWAQTGPRDEEAQPVVLDVLVVQASKEAGEDGPGCEELKKRLPMDFGSLRLVQSQEFELRLGQATQFVLPSGRPVRMLPLSIIDRHLHLHFEMSGIINTRLRMLSGRPMIVGGERHGDGQLIIEVTPSFRSGPGSPPIRRSRPTGPSLQQVRGREAGETGP